jgi:chorismate dehydratase
LHESITELPRVSASNYSNSAPLIWSFLYGSMRGQVELVLDNAPARSAELLARNDAEIALVPVIEYQRIDDALIVPDVCVGAHERVRSVCLITKEKDLKDVKSVALDTCSRTSVALTQIIFREFLLREPEFKAHKPDIKAMLETNDAALLIGDPALSVSREEYRVFDLAELWREYTGCGFAFAVWMVRESERAIADKIDFARARDEGVNHAEEIITSYESEIPLSRTEFREYLLENICYELDDELLVGLEIYFKLAEKHNLISSLKTLRFL